MSEIKNVGDTWMALNSFKCNYMTLPHFKGLRADKPHPGMHRAYVLQITVACID